MSAMSEQSWPTRGPASYFPSIETTYGESIDHWMTVIGSVEGEKHAQTVARLKDEHGLGHGHANALVAWHRQQHAS